MENHSSTPARETLGALFRRLRLERSLDIADVATETRIPPKTIRAIEADDFESLPAQAFARGFYQLYAKMFDLEQEEILRRFDEEYDGLGSARTDDAVSPPSWQKKNLGTMADRPSITFGSIIGLGLLLIILTTAGLSWYAGFNPATYVSKWLRGLQEPVVVEEQQTAAPPPQLAPPPEPVTTEPAEPVEPAAAGAAIPPEAAAPLPESVKYQLVAEFLESTQVTVTIDEETTRSLVVTGGTIETWQARKSILLELPAGTTTRLYLNGIVIPLPPASGDTIRVSIPEYLLD